MMAINHSKKRRFEARYFTNLTWKDFKLNFKLVQIRSFLFIWLVTVLHISLPDGLSTKIVNGNLSLLATPEQIRTAYGPGDAGSLLEAAITWAKFTKLSDTQVWIVHAWTPGLPIIEIPLIWFSKIIPIYFSFLITLIVLWLVALRLLLNQIKNQKVLYFGFAIIYAWTLSWDGFYVFREYFFYSEGIAYALLLIGVAFILSETRLIFGGAVIGLSIMVRHTTDITNYFLLLILILIWLKNKQKFNQYIRKKRKNPKLKPFQDDIRIRQFSLYFVGILVSTGIWRFLVSPIYFGGKLFSISSASGEIPRLIWWRDEGIFKDFGINWACQLDHVKCDYYAKIGEENWKRSELLISAIKAILKNPIKFLHDRLTIGWKHWNSDSYPVPLTIKYFITYVFLAISLISIILLTNRILKAFKIGFIENFFAVFYIGQILSLLFFHFESRYFMPIRLISIVYLVWFLDKKLSSPVS